jgi:16S rRNA (guanine527-N7)-methyltransferase
MDPARIAELLQPFFAATDPGLSQAQLDRIAIYLDLLLRWNARINLTAVRQPEHIVTRHFGESLFAARHLFPDSRSQSSIVLDVGSGAGFPGLPIKIWAPHVHLTLIESNHKKATFLREVLRALALTTAEVFSDRAEDYPAASAGVVTLRAVERFEKTLPIAASLVAPAGRLALLIGDTQLSIAPTLTPNFHWSPVTPIPLSTNRVLAIGSAAVNPVRNASG